MPLLGNVEIYGRIPNFLEICNFAWRRTHCLITLWGIEIYWLFFSRTYLGTLEDRTIRLLRQLFIAPVSEVGEEDL